MKSMEFIFWSTSKELLRLFSSSSFVDVWFIFVFCYLGNGTSSISLKDREANNLVFLTVEFS